MKRYLALLAVLLLAVPSFGQLTGFSKYKEITISNTNVAATYSNAIAYVPIVADANIGAICQADGDDVQFSNSDNTATLTFERIKFAVAAGAADGDFYILVPALSTSATTVIRCYYGKAGATSASSAANTFATANGWISVLHLEESTEPYADATGVNNSDSGGVPPARATGIQSYGQDFNGSTHWINIPDSASLDIGTNDLYISAWVYLHDVSSRRMIFAKRALAGGAGYYFDVTPTAYISLFAGDGTDTDATNDEQTVTANTWTHIGVAWDRSSLAKTLKDGVRQATGRNMTAVGDVSNAIAVAVSNRAADDPGDFYVDGIVDEIRVLAVADFTTIPIGALLKWEYYNAHDGHAAGNELTWGAEQSTGEATYVPKIIIISERINEALRLWHPDPALSR